MKRNAKKAEPTGGKMLRRYVERPGEAGLANEMRPGLGTRGTPPASKRRRRGASAHDSEPLGRNAPLPPAKGADAEPPIDPMAQEFEHDTGVSGHSGAD
jgi:hypothetical protein